MLIRFFCLAIVTSVMASCTVLQPAGVPTDKASIQNQHAVNAEIALQQLQDIDTLIKLDNHWLAEQIEAALVVQADSSEKFHFRKFKLKFDKQLIALDALLDVNDDDGNMVDNWNGYRALLSSKSTQKILPLKVAAMQKPSLS
jgi:hypothetical protein